MDPFRKKKAKRAFLEALELADGYPLEDGVVRAHASDFLKPPLKDVEWREVIENCLAADLVRKVEDRLDEDLIQYTITERGKAAIA